MSETTNVSTVSPSIDNIQPGDCYVFDAAKALAPDTKGASILVDVRVMSVEADFIHCTIANRDQIVPIKRDVFVKIIDLQSSHR